jgi:ATP-dependent DNA helicase DinG
VLFASGKQMREVYALLPEDLRRCTLMQGTMPKMEMLSRHRAAIDSGERSVLFGLQSFSEGVDLPREYCTHVVCAKLPFSVPDSPLEEARREWIESQGRSPFIDITVPETAVRLKQQLGRLIRTDEDHGTATILDRRLVSRRWGRLLMRGLPDFELVVEPARGGAASGSRG